MIQKTIEELEKKRVDWNISRESVEFINEICKKIKPKYVLEIGTFNGYSALWLSKNSGKVITIEIDKNRAEEAKKNIIQADARNIEVIHGDAFERLQMMLYKFDLVLIDGKKSEYKTYLELVLNLVNKNALIFADNTISHKEKLQNFFDYLESSNLYYKELNIGKGLMVISKEPLNILL